MSWLVYGTAYFLIGFLVSSVYTIVNFRGEEVSNCFVEQVQEQFVGIWIFWPIASWVFFMGLISKVYVKYLLFLINSKTND